MTDPPSKSARGDRTAKVHDPEALELHVDTLSSSGIVGWAWRPGRPQERVELSFRVNDRVVGRTVCAHFRPDLAASGRGDGRYGFKHDLAGEFEHTSGLEVFEGHRVVHRIVPPKDAAEVVYFDVTDLFIYWRHHKTASGIQRVQGGLIVGLWESGFWRSSYALVFRAEPGAPVQRLPVETFLELHRSFQCGSLDDDEWGALLDARLRGEASTWVPRTGAIFFVTGAGWIYPEFMDEVAELKERHALRVHLLVYDLVPVKHPEWCDSTQAESLRTYFYEATTVVDRYYAISHAVAEELRSWMRETVQIDLDDVDVLPLGVRTRLTGMQASSDRIAALVEEPYVLYVATLEPRKNHALLVDVWRRLTAELGEACPVLVWVGRFGWGVQGLVDELDRSDWLNGMIRHLSDVSDTELGVLYRGCLFSVLPSSYEGWGLPVSESLASGKTAIVSDVGALREAGDDLVVYCRPGDPAHWLDSIRSLVVDAQRRVDLEKKIRDEYDEVTWQHSAVALDEAINEADEHRTSARAFPCPMDRLVRFGAGRLVMVGPDGDPVPTDVFLQAAAWRANGNDGVWFVRKKIAVRFRVDDGLVNAAITVFASMKFPPRYKQHRVTVSSEDVPCVVVDMDGVARERTVVLVVTPSRSEVELTFEIDRLVADPESDPASVALCDIFLTPKHGKKARMSYLESRHGVAWCV